MYNWEDVKMEKDLELDEKDLELDEEDLELDEEIRQLKIEEQKKTEEKNEKNIDGTILYMSKHIDGDRTKEYIKFIKEARKLKAKIAKKKAKIARIGALEEAYLKKEDHIREYYKDMEDSNNNDRIGEIWNEGEKVYIDSCKNIGIMRAINDAENRGYYIEQVSIKSCYGNHSKYDDISECKELNDLLQKHYNNINARIMGEVLIYYMEQLEYWKNYLKEIEKIEEVQELE